MRHAAGDHEESFERGRLDRHPVTVRGGRAEAAAQDSTTITTVYETVLSGVTGSVASAGIGWAISAIGLAGGDSASLNEIASELQAIDQELTAIENTLVQLLDAIDNQTCVGTETQASLTEAVDNITTLFTNYQTQFIQPSENGDAIIPSQLDAWMSAVLTRPAGSRRISRRSTTRCISTPPT
jgi:hypothetical protein